MYLESVCKGPRAGISLPLIRDSAGILRSDWEPLLPILADNRRSVSARAETFHASMARVILDQALALRNDYNIDQIGLTGGVFQNRVLVDEAIALLTYAGFDVLLADALPCNDAGICFGQAAELAAREALHSNYE